MSTYLNQREFSNYVLTGLLQTFPQFMDYYNFDHETLTIEYSSPHCLLSLWITTRDLEITVGFDGKNGQCNWHVHMSQFGANEPEEELQEAVGLIIRILTGNEIIAFNGSFGYYLTENPEDEIKDKQKDEILEFKRWKEL